MTNDAHAVPDPALYRALVRPAGARFVNVIDQRALPHAVRMVRIGDAATAAVAIRDMVVRGAPLIGAVGAYGLALALDADASDDALAHAHSLLDATRPTAVNLRWALDRMTATARETSGDAAAVWQRLHAEAETIWEEDRAMCRRIGAAGQPLVPDGTNVLTHCNAGALATGGIGTALAPVYLAHEAGRRVHVFVDETRPVLQGARLTAWELEQAGVPCTLIVDGVAASLMRAARVDVVFVGADRIAGNGDFANKIGTYGVAVLARHHDVPLYCCAPSSTIDAAIPDGAAIPIEQRSPDEVRLIAGRSIAPATVAAFNPAFDVTPANLVTGYLTDRGCVQPPFSAPPR